MSRSHLESYKVFEGELKEYELIALRALVQEGLHEETDARFLFLLLNYSLEKFKQR